MFYIILDLETGNYVATFDTEAEALADVRLAVERFGRPYAAPWALASKDVHGRMVAIAEGDALIDRAFRAIPA